MNKIKLLWVFIIILLAFNLFAYLYKLGGDSGLVIIGNVLPVICSFVAAICLFFAFTQFRKFDFAKTAWLLLFIGIFLNFCAESIYAYSESVLKMDMNENFPFIADYFWCTAYILFILGLAIMFLGYKKSGFPIGNVKIYALISMTLIAIFAVVTYYLLLPIINDDQTDFIAKFFYVYYPVADLFTVIPALFLIYIISLMGRGIVSRPWKYLAFGFFCFTFADLLYSYLSWMEQYKSGHIIDIVWHAGYLLIGMAGLYQMNLIQSINKEVEK